SSHQSVLRQVVVDPIACTYHCLGERFPGQPQAWREVVVAGIDEGVGKGSSSERTDLAWLHRGDRRKIWRYIEVRKLAVVFRIGRYALVAEAEIHGEAFGHAPVVLYEEVPGAGAELIVLGAKLNRGLLSESLQEVGEG